jgi:hypothetical protein
MIFRKKTSPFNMVHEPLLHLQLHIFANVTVIVWLLKFSRRSEEEKLQEEADKLDHLLAHKQSVRQRVLLERRVMKWYSRLCAWVRCEQRLLPLLNTSNLFPYIEEIRSRYTRAVWPSSSTRSLQCLTMCVAVQSPLNEGSSENAEGEGSAEDEENATNDAATEAHNKEERKCKLNRFTP